VPECPDDASPTAVTTHPDVRGTILVVDDEPLVREIAVLALKGQASTWCVRATAGKLSL